MKDSRRASIHLSGSYSGFNKGDLAILTSIVERLNAYGDPDIHVPSKHPDALRRFLSGERFHAYQATTSYLGWRAFARLARADAIVLGGGGLFFSRRLYDPFSNHLINLAAVCALNRLFFRKPLALFAVGASDLDSPIARRLAAFVLASADVICARDEHTLRLFSELTRKRIDLCCDPAFLLRPARPDSARGTPLAGARRRVLLCLNDALYASRPADVRALLAELEGFCDMTVCQNDTGGRSVRALAASYRAHGRTLAVLDTAPLAPREIIEAFGAFDYVVSAPMHGALFAHLAGVRPICIAWDRKMREFCRMTGNRNVAGPDELARIPRMIEAYEPISGGREQEMLAGLDACFARLAALYDPGDGPPAGC